MASDDRDLYSGMVRLHVVHHASEGPIFGLGMIEELECHSYNLSAKIDQVDKGRSPERTASRQPACAERLRLLEILMSATDRYIAAVDQLHGIIATAPLREHQNAVGIFEAARREHEKARKDLEAHRSTHQC